MERLTKRDENGFAISGIETNTENGDYDILDCDWLEKALEPEKIEQLKGEVFGLKVDKQELEQYRAIGPIDRLRELAQADREGRCVVLPPIRIGDAAFFLINNQIFSGHIYYIRWEKHKAFGEHGLISADGVCGAFSANLSDYGKTVFLTREEAEAELEGMKNG